MTHTRNRIAAVVVTYNRKALLLENLAALQAQAYHRFDILLIDNHSTDGTRREIQSYFYNSPGLLQADTGSGHPKDSSAAAIPADADHPQDCFRLDSGQQVLYFDTGENLGGAGGFSYGIAKAAALGYDYIWLMDDDSIPEPNALMELVRSARELGGHFGFLSSRVLWTDGSPCKMNVLRKTATKNLTAFTTEIEPISIASFVSMFLPVRVVKRMGLPIREFFIWTDDWEYSRRISRKYACYGIKKSTVIHKTANNDGADISRDSGERLDRYRYAYRNEVYLYRREGFTGMLHLLLRTPLHILRILLRAPGNRLKRIGIVLGSTWNGFFFNPPIRRLQDLNPE